MSIPEVRVILSQVEVCTCPVLKRRVQVARVFTLYLMEDINLNDGSTLTVHKEVPKYRLAGELRQKGPSEKGIHLCSEHLTVARSFVYLLSFFLLLLLLFSSPLRPSSIIPFIDSCLLSFHSFPDCRFCPSFTFPNQQDGFPRQKIDLVPRDCLVPCSHRLC